MGDENSGVEKSKTIIEEDIDEITVSKPKPISYEQNILEEDEVMPWE